MRKTTLWAMLFVSSMAVVHEAGPEVRTSAAAPAAAAIPEGGLVESAPGFGWTLGEFSVSGDGAAQYSLPLWVPQGRGRSTPELALSYSSRGGNGPLGVGWSMTGLSSVTWCAHTIAQDGYTDAGHFDGADPLCLDGNRLLSAGAGLPQQDYSTERETFSRITGYGTQDGVPDHFVVETKDGLILTYGQTDDARLDAFRLEPKRDPGDPGQPDFENPGLVRESTTDKVTVAWALDKIEDRDGNATTVEYTEAEGDQGSLWYAETRLAAINYGPNRRVELDYEFRPDVIDAFGGGVHTRSTRRVTGIRMLGGPEGGEAEPLREYRFEYTNESMTGRSLLTKITECDPDGACKKALPMKYSMGSDDFEPLAERMLDDQFLTFVQTRTGDFSGDGRSDLEYRGAKYVFGADDPSGFGEPVNPGGDIGTTSLALGRSVDIDADGRTDLMADESDQEDGVDGHRWKLFESDGTRFVEGPGADVGPWFEEHPWDANDPASLADLDGNGLPDFVPLIADRDTDEKSWSYRLNTGARDEDRFEPSQSVAIPPEDATADKAGTQVVDTDGDGRAEILEQRWLPDDVPGGYRGWGVNAAGGVEGVRANIANTKREDDDHDFLPPEALFGDLNGDGLQDAIMTRRTKTASGAPLWQLRAQLNSGNGFAPPAPATPPGWTDVTMGRMYIEDFDGDGHDDVGVVAFEGQGDSRVDMYEWRNGGFTHAWTLDDTQYGALPVDIDANGVMDLVVGLPAVDGKSRVQVYRHAGGPPDQLERIGLIGGGPVVEVDYTNLADRDTHIPCTDAVYPLICPAKGDTVVEEHRFAAALDPGTGFPSWDPYIHDYADARADLEGRGWLGFGRHTVTRELSGTITSTLFDNTTRDPGTGSYPYANLPDTSATFTPTGPANAGSRITTDYDNVIVAAGPTYRVEQRKVTEVSEERPPGVNVWQNLRTRTVDTTYDGFGNRDLVVSATVGGRKVTEDPTFSNDTGSWLIGLPTRTVVTGCDTANRCTSRTTSFEHYPDGNPHLTVVEPDQPALKLTTEVVYDSFGNVTSVERTDNAGQARTERFEYDDPDKLHPTATVNAAGHRTQIETHPGLGVQLEVTDPNGVPTTMRYDKFGRLRETNHADGSYERITHSAPGWQSTTVDFSGGGRTEVVVDQFGRERNRSAMAFDGRMVVAHHLYDLRGRVTMTSRAGFTTDPRQDTTYEYDNLDRPTTITAPDDLVVRHEYKGLETHTYDGLGNHSYTVGNRDGDIASSFDDDPASDEWLETSFEYDGFGQTTRTTAPDDTAQVLRYDTLGRQDQLVNPSSGTTTMAYNAFGELATRADATGVTATYTYDELGRVERIVSPDGTATNTWDTADNGIGLLDRARSADGVTIAHTYTPESKPATTAWTIDGTRYEVGFDYDEIGRQDTLIYPAIPGAPAGTGRLTLNYAYNPSGYLEQVKDAAADGPVFWQGVSRTADGQLTEEHLGNGAIGTRGYDPATGLPTDVAVTGPGGAGELSHLTLDYDANRNVIHRSDPVNGREESYDYDTLDRLEGWSLTSPGQPAATTSYTYDAVGNMKTETTPERTIDYHHGEDGAPAHALSGMGNDHTRFTYDAAGRQLTAVRRAVTYNHVGLPKTVTYGQTGIRRELTYDPNGARARNSDANKTLVTVGGLFERLVINPAADPPPERPLVHNTHNIVVDGRVVAQVIRKQETPDGPVLPSAGTQYLHADAQGSTALVTDGAGRHKTEFFFDPWGQRTTVTGATTSRNEGAPRQGYTGHEHDDDPNLVNAKGRIYDPELRRFLTPDPIMAGTMSSQAHNRYAYVRNNPATLTDPSGLCDIECGWIEDADMMLFHSLMALARNPMSDLGAASRLLLSSTNGCLCVIDGAEPSDSDSGTTDDPDEPAEPLPPGCENPPCGDQTIRHTDPGIPPSSDGPDGPMSELTDVQVEAKAVDPWGAFGPGAWLTTAAIIGGSGGLMTAIFGKYTELTEITQILMGMRDLAVESALQIHELEPLIPRDFGNTVDYLWKTQIEKAIEDGVLPTNLEVVPRGAAGPDVWIQIGDTKFAISWDSMSSTVASVVEHDDKYIGRILYGQDGAWYLNLDVLPILHPSTKGGWSP